jgi:hypothetical protein
VINKLKVLFLSLLFVGCGSDFDPSSRITSTRVLAVEADQPFAAPGETVSLKGLAFDPEARALSWGWATCPNPIGPTPLDCFTQIAMGKGGAFEVGGDTFTTTIPAGALSSSSSTVGVAVVVCPGTLGLGDGVVPVRCTTSDGRVLPLDQFDLGMKRVFVRAKDKNANPMAARVTWDGAAWPEDEVKSVAACGDDATNMYDDCGGEKHSLAIVPAPASFERGQDEYGTAFQESLVAQYYGTEGIFEAPVRRAENPETGFVARIPGDITLFMLLRDDRGGVVWTTRHVRAH